MYCENCGAFLPDESKHCPECGVKRSDFESNSEYSDFSYTQEPEPPRQTTNQWSQPQGNNSWQSGNTQFSGNNQSSQNTQSNRNTGWQQPGQGSSQNFDSHSLSPNLICALGYIPILFWLPMVAAKDEPMAKDISNQGLLLLIAGIICNILSSFLSSIFYSFYDFIPFAFPFWSSAFINLIFGIISFALFICMIVGFVKALSGKFFEIPLIGKIRIIR